MQPSSTTREDRGAWHAERTAARSAQVGDGKSASLLHDAFFYETIDDYIECVRAFALAGFDAGEPVLVAAPEPKLDTLRLALGRADGAISFLDMHERARNPARIIPLIQEFVDQHPGRSVRFAGEPFWPGRTQPEIVEGHRHEALLNIAFEGRAVHIICPYDVSELPPMVIEDAKRTHPTLVQNGNRHASECYVDPLLVYAMEERPLPEPDGEPVRICMGDGLAVFRRDVERFAPGELERDRLADLVVAANEAAANSLTHGGGVGKARMWWNDSSVVVELRDRGVIRDPLVGRMLPDPLQETGRGVWLMNQLCDLVEVRSGEDGTTVRLHVGLP
jgi:anti-sigma regulatory factor (Ser/Thr protein kinase)